MNLLKNISTIMLVLVIATTGIPCFLAEDASRDGNIDLQDAILQVQDFTAAADSAAPFAFRFEKMLNTLASVAGLKSFIDPDRESKSSQQQTRTVISLDKITNSFFIHPPAVQSSTVVYPENPTAYQSRYLDPAIPPPRIS